MQKTIETKGTIFSLLVLLACVRPLRGRPLLAEVSKTIETIGTIFFSCLQAGTGRRNGLSLLSLKPPQARKNLSLLSLLSLKKNKRAKNNPLVLLFIFCFLRFLYNRLFPIRLVFLIVFYILAFPNYIGFF